MYLRQKSSVSEVAYNGEYTDKYVFEYEILYLPDSALNSKEAFFNAWLLFVAQDFVKVRG